MPQTVAGKRCSTDESEGARLWNAVMERATAAAPLPGSDAARYGTPVLVKPRLGQGAFRVLVTDAYERHCAVSGEKTLPILDAAHIRSYADGGLHEGSNGLLLRTDIHKLFDLGYVTFDQDRKVRRRPSPQRGFRQRQALLRFARHSDQVAAPAINGTVC